MSPKKTTQWQRQPIVIATRKGRQSVPGFQHEKVPGLAITPAQLTPPRGAFTITHVPSGYTVILGTFGKFVDAARMLRRLGKLGSWDRDRSAIAHDQQLRERVRAMVGYT